MSSQLQPDVYLTAQAEADTQCCWYLNIDGTDMLAYVTKDGALRLKEVVSTKIHTIVQGVQWCSPLNYLPDNKGTRLYFLKKDGTLWLIYFKRVLDLKTPPLAVNVINFPISAKSFSITYRVEDQLWVMLTDDLAQHTIFTANDDHFITNLKSRVVYDIQFDPLIRVTQPSISLHIGGNPKVRDILTVCVDYFDTTTNYKGVATYVVHLFKREDEI